MLINSNPIICQFIITVQQISIYYTTGSLLFLNKFWVEQALTLFHLEYFGLVLSMRQVKQVAVVLQKHIFWHVEICT